jgi:hypothetical protein
MGTLITPVRPDFWITAVRYSPDRKHIQAVKMSQFDGTLLVNPDLYTRLLVVSHIDAGRHIVTATWNQTTGRYDVGAKVITVKIGNDVFIKTEADDTEADNLGELPEIA